jgi:cytochrome c2
MRKASLLFILALAGFVTLLRGALPGKSQLTASPGSVVRGERILTTNGCLNCHTLKGKGGTLGPDLAVPSKTAGTPALFATSLWNHLPAMLLEFAATNTPLPALKVTDAADLFTFFYATLYFSPRGDASRGGTVFVEKQCSSCHSEILDTQSGRSFVETWMDLKDPSMWAERMWNHATEMDSATSNRGIRWPILSDQDVVDLVLFLSTRAGTQPEADSFTIGEPELGQAVFEDSCASCHSLGQREKSKVDLLSRKGPLTVTGYIASMWNHVPAMRRQNGSTPKLKAGQMPDLIAFLFAQRYFFEPGDADRGRKVYEEKDCATCHQVRRKAIGAPNLSESVESFSPITLTAATWRHGIGMAQVMRQEGIAWPQFKGREMADLIAYLNSRRIVRIASVKKVH